MVLNGVSATVLIALLWLPVYAVAGGLYTVLAEHAASRFGRRGLAVSWAVGALAITAIVSAYSYASGLSWSSSTPVYSGIAVGAVMFIPAALCFIGPTVLVANRLRKDGSIRHRSGMLKGATLAAGTWVVICAIVALSAEL